MSLFSAVLLTVASAEAGKTPGFGLELSIWKYVVLVAAGGAIIAYAVKRIAEVVNDRKTRAIIEQVGEAPSEAPSEPEAAASKTSESTESSKGLSDNQ